MRRLRLRLVHGQLARASLLWASLLLPVRVALAQPAEPIAPDGDPIGERTAPEASEGSDALPDAAEPAQAPVAEPGSDPALPPPIVDATSEPPPMPTTPQPPRTPPAEPPPDVSAPVTAADPEAAVDAPAPQPDPWRYSEFAWNQWVSLNSLTRGGQQSYDPGYVWQFSFRPRWYLGDATFFRLRQDLVIELTDSNTTDYAQELVVGDTNLLLSHDFANWEPFEAQKVRLRGWFETDLPTSKASRATETVAVLRGRSWLFWSFQNVLSGLQLINLVSYAYRAATADTVQSAESYPCTSTGPEDAGLCTSVGGYAAVRHVVSASLGAYLQILAQLSVYATFSFQWTQAPRFSPYTIDTITGAQIVVADTSPSKWRNSRTLYLEATYQITSWWTATLYYDTTFSERNPDTTLRAPFNPIDSVLGLSFSFVAGPGRAVLN